MAYQFLRKDRGSSAALRRTAIRQAEAAVAMLARDDLPLDERVHEARKTVKRLRGLIRLVRPVFEGYATENAALRTAGQSLAGLREATVLLQTFDDLADAVPKEAAARLRAPLAASLAEAVTPTTATLAAFSVQLRAFSSRAADWHLKARGFDAFDDGLVRCHARARAAQKRARRKPTVKAVHDWRKCVKDHLYQTRLFLSLWPEIMQPRAEAADRLAEDLGQVNDLSVLIAALPADPDAAVLIAAAKARQTALLAAAHPASRRLFADAPKDYAARLRQWWKIWRDENPAPA